MKISVQLGTVITFVQCNENNGASIMVLQNKAHSTPVYFKISMISGICNDICDMAKTFFNLKVSLSGV